MGTVTGWIINIFGSIAGIPGLGKILAVILGSLTAVAAVVTAAVAMWHGLVNLVGALAELPGLQGLAPVVAALQADSTVVDTDSNAILSWIERFSVIPVPQAKNHMLLRFRSK